LDLDTLITVFKLYWSPSTKCTVLALAFTSTVCDTDMMKDVGGEGLDAEANHKPRTAFLIEKITFWPLEPRNAMLQKLSVMSRCYRQSKKSTSNPVESLKRLQYMDLMKWTQTALLPGKILKGDHLTRR
jgi:hypothetical protein